MDFSGIGDWLGNNSSWLAPTIGMGGNLFGQYSKSNDTSAVIDYLREREQNNYDMAKANNDAYLQWSERNQAAQSAARAAANAAKSATERARQEAAQKAMKIEMKGYKKANKNIKPYLDASNTLLPQRVQNAQIGNQLSSLLGAYFQSPQMQQQMTAPAVTNLSSQQLALPDYLLNKKG